MARSDRDWQRFAESDPYWAVLTEDQFRGSTLEGDRREEFFARGEEHVEELFDRYWDLFGHRFEPRSALDFGCGVGRVLPPLRARCPQVVGVDVSRAMLEEAEVNLRRAGVDGVRLIHDTDTLEQVEGEFDLVHSALVLQHIRPRRGLRIFERLCRLVGKGGVAVVQVTVATSTTTRHRVLAELRDRIRPLHRLLNRLGGRAVDAPIMRMHVYSLVKLRRAVAAAGCELVDVHSIGGDEYSSAVLWIRRP